MTDLGTVIFDPLLPWMWIAALAGLTLIAVVLAGLRGLSGWGLRLLGGAVILVALANPSLQRSDRQQLSNIVIAVVDDSASQRLSDRQAQTESALAQLRTDVARLDNTELRVVRVGDSPDNLGTQAMTALGRAIAQEPRDRIAGVVLISDGHIHDMESLPQLPAPLHLLMTGHDGDWDRRLVLTNAPAFAVVGEEVTLTLRIEEDGTDADAQSVPLDISVDGAEPQRVVVLTGQDIKVPVTLKRGGLNVIRFETPTAEGELTDRNNATIVQINGVRDRLRVLLVSGEPHAGERTWRNLLKSDSSVDLVHFTILRSPDKSDGVPVTEVSLIAFPTHELFVEKINEFDLIIFDRYSQRGLLPPDYFQSIMNYVDQGGAVLVSSGSEFATVESLAHSLFGPAIPADPTAIVLEQPFTPAITAQGHRHPVTEGLDANYPPRDGETLPSWGRWFRQIEVVPTAGDILMSGASDAPLLILNRVGMGRVALLASDQVWLWGRGFEGGGPQLELMRRLAHWMMKEPELEEEALSATASGQHLVITRRSLKDDPRKVTIREPSGKDVTLDMAEIAPGQFQAEYDAPDLGLYRLTQDELTAVAAIGPASPKEFETTLATETVVEPALAATGGGALRIEEGFSLRKVAMDRPMNGRGWIGIADRKAFVARDIRLFALIWPGLALLLAALLVTFGWLREGRS